jgi:hypothetical protein
MSGHLWAVHCSCTSPESDTIRSGGCAGPGRERCGDRPGNDLEPASARARPRRTAAGRVRGVQREQHGQAEPAQLIQDGLEPLRVVGVLRAVDGGKDVLVGLGAQADGRWRAVMSSGPSRSWPRRSCCRSAGCCLRGRLATQVPDALLGGAVQVVQDPYDSAVEFLRHAGRRSADRLPRARPGARVVPAWATAVLVSPWTGTTAGGFSAKSVPRRSIIRPSYGPSWTGGHLFRPLLRRGDRSPVLEPVMCRTHTTRSRIRTHNHCYSHFVWLPH